MSDLFQPAEWVARAACAGLDPDLFFPGRGMNRDTDAAKRVCNGIPGKTAPCPVRDECLDDAMRHDMQVGVWGGLSERERRRYRPQWKLENGVTAWQPIEHGTDKGYHQHWRREDSPVTCRPCLEAHAAAKQENKAKRAQPIEHGTERGYRQHINRDGAGSACAECLEAVAVVNRARRARRSA